jgi:hypothetical protein
MPDIGIPIAVSCKMKLQNPARNPGPFEVESIFIIISSGMLAVL